MEVFKQLSKEVKRQGVPTGRDNYHSAHHSHLPSVVDDSRISHINNPRDSPHRRESMSPQHFRSSCSPSRIMSIHSHHSPMRQQSPAHHHHHHVAPVPNFIDDSYNRMKKSCDRIAQVLGLERPSFDRPHMHHECPSPVRDRSSTSADVVERNPLRQKSPSRESRERREGSKFASVSNPANLC